MTEKPWVRRLALGGRVLVGATFLTAAFFKALHPAGFARQIDTYGWLPSGATTAAAFFFLTLEFLVGAALVLGARPRLAAAGGTALLALFTGLMAEAWYSGRTVDCGCFGGALEKGPGATALIDLLLVALLLPTLVSARARTRRHWQVGAVVATAFVGVGLALASPYLPVDPLVTKLSPGKTVPEMGLDTLVPEQGTALIALLDLEDEPSIHAVPGLNAVLAAFPQVDVLGLAAAGPDARALFGWSTGAGFPVDEVGETTAGALARALPRFALLVDGRVVAVWNTTPPAPGALQAALGGASS